LTDFLTALKSIDSNSSLTSVWMSGSDLDGLNEIYLVNLKNLRA